MANEPKPVECFDCGHVATYATQILLTHTSQLPPPVIYFCSVCMFHGLPSSQAVEQSPALPAHSGMGMYNEVEDIWVMYWSLTKLNLYLA